MMPDSDLEFVSLTGDILAYILRCPASGSEALFDDAFTRLAIRLFHFQHARVAPYRLFCESRKLNPSSVARWQDIPALPVTAFKQQDVTSLTPERRSRVFHSSGTTARAFSRHYHDADSLGLYEASLLPWFQAQLLPEGAASAECFHLLALTPRGVLAPNSSLVHMFETVARAFPWASRFFGAGLDDRQNWSLDLPVILRKLEAVSREGLPMLLLGTAFSFVHLLDFLEEQKLRLHLPQGSRALETGGYKGKSREMPKQELHDWMCRRLGLAQNQIVSEYGMNELSSQAYDLVAGTRETGFTERRFQFPFWVRARIISPETGREAEPRQPGLVAILDLANVRSCLAIQTEDLGIADSAGLQIQGRARLAEPRGCSLMPA